MKKKDWDYWMHLRSDVQAEIQKHPELMEWRDAGLWRDSLAPSLHGEVEGIAIGFRTNTLYYDTRMPIIYKMMEKGFSVSIHAVNMQYLEVVFYSKASFKHWKPIKDQEISRYRGVASVEKTNIICTKGQECQNTHLVGLLKRDKGATNITMIERDLELLNGQEVEVIIRKVKH